MMLKLIVLPPAARFLKKIKEKPLKNLFQKTVDEILIDPYCESANFFFSTPLEILKYNNLRKI